MQKMYEIGDEIYGHKSFSLPQYINLYIELEIECNIQFYKDLPNLPTVESGGTQVHSPQTQ